jgi:hypothetical protein
MAPAWRIVKDVHSGPFGGFSAVVAVGRDGGWAFDAGPAPTAWHRSGSAWTQVPFPGHAGETVVSAAASSASNVWAITSTGSRSRALRWNGHTWSVMRSFSQPADDAVVLSRSDIWVFGQADYPSAGFGSWHYNGRTWSHVASGHGLQGGSGLSWNNVWAFEGTDIAHWNGAAWSRTSLSSLLPAKQLLNGPALAGVFAVSRHSVYAIGNGGLQDEGGPTVVLHWNGYQWSRLAQGNFGFGTQPVQQISSDGHGGLWLPMPGSDGQKSYLVHYSAGHLTPAALPGGPYRIDVDAIAQIPGTPFVLAGGNTHAYARPGTSVTAVLLGYGA